MKNTIDLLRAISTLLWPAFAFWLFFTYKEEIRSLLRRIRKGKLLGQEIELEDSLRQLQEEATKAASEVKEIPKFSPPEQFGIPLGDASYDRFWSTTENKDEKGDRALSVRDSYPDPIDTILEESARSPKAALLLLAAEMEKELKRVLFGSGWHAGHDIRGIHEGFDILARLEVLPKHVGGSVRLFSDMRNRLIHGGNATDDDVIRAVDSGITILKALRSIPLEVHKVHHSGVDLYSDSEGKNVMVGVKGVILETTSPGAATKRHAVFPTTRDHFRRGKRVAWEWNGRNKYGPSWFRDPDTGEIKQAFHESTEFIGRNLNDA
jgi:hypothetical protein